MRRRTIRLTSIGIASVVLAVAGLPIAAAADSRAPLAGSAPSWVATASPSGDVPGDAQVRARVHLAPRGGLAALQRAALRASTPGSSTYRHFLSPSQYRSRYAPTRGTVRAATRYFQQAGLTARSSGSGAEEVVVTGRADRMERAFSTQLKYYQRAGHRVQAPSSTLSLPTSLERSVLAVTGLDTTRHPVKRLDAGAGFRNAKPCSRSYGEVPATAKADGTPLPRFRDKVLPYAPCGYVGSQYRSAYTGGTGLTGAGITVAVLGAYASPTIAEDANTYAVRHGDGAYRPGQLTQRLPASFTVSEDCGDPTEYYGEESLDVEAVHAMARGAAIRYYGVPDCENGTFIDVYRRVLDENTAQIVTTSYGDLEGAYTPQQLAIYTVLFARGALQGVSFLFSSGDSGDETDKGAGPQVNFWASDPLVTAVGGTADGIGASGRLELQTGWGTHGYGLSSDGTSWNDDQGFLYGSGGGTSKYFPRPPYQAGTVSGTKRAVPDVAMDGDPSTGMLIGQTQVFPDGTYYDEYRIGGTSLSSPLFAGMTALAIQSAGHRVGLLNPLIYAKRGAFTDVLPNPRDPGVVRPDYVNGVDASEGIDYTVRTFDEDTSLKTTRGYDLVTGVGAPNPGWLTALR